MKMAKSMWAILLVLFLCLTACSSQTEQTKTGDGKTGQGQTTTTGKKTGEEQTTTTGQETGEEQTTTTGQETGEEQTTTTGQETGQEQTTTTGGKTGQGQTATTGGKTGQEQTATTGGKTSQGQTTTTGGTTNQEKPSGPVDGDETANLPKILPGETAVQISKYVDENGDTAIIPKGFTVSALKGEHTVSTGVVVIGPDKSEFVWVPTTQTALAVHDFGSYFYGNSLSGYWDETEQTLYQDMVKSVEQYGGFYMGRFEASCGGGDNVSNYIPASKRSAQPWVRFSPQDTAVICQNLYADNETVQGFFPWGINYDTTLQWLIDSGCKTKNDVAKDSTSWGNYSDDTFSQGANGSTTGQWEEAGANNIYDLAGNNWEWTQERYGADNYVMRGGGYNLMGGSCSGAHYPAAIRDPLPGNDHHPNVTFRVALFVK